MAKEPPGNLYLPQRPIHPVRVLLVLAGLLLIAGAGCLDGSSEDAEPASSESIEDSRQRQDLDQTAREDPGPLERPPTWLPGEYWTVRVDSTLMDEPVEWTRVVAGYTSEAYLVGQPADNASTAGLLLHVPGLGEVSQANLSYSIHGATFTPLMFPLEDGRTWQTSFEGQPVNATVETTGDQARVHYCCSRNVTATYDPDIRAISEMTVDDGFLEYEVVDHGFAFEGTIEVPRDRELAFLQGRVAGGLTTRGGAGPPAGEAEVSAERDHLAFTQIVGNTDLTPAPGTGAYVERATHPNGTSYLTEQAASTEGLELAFHEATNASGTWRFEHVAAGPGVAFTEGVAFSLERHELG